MHVYRLLGSLVPEYTGHFITQVRLIGMNGGLHCSSSISIQSQ